MNKKIPASELIINPDGSIYHLNLMPEDIAENIFLVGDQERVSRVSCYFDAVEIEKSKREFVTHTGSKNGKRFTVISTGIGTDNIDIVLNELDALVNIDFNTRQVKEKHQKLNIIRMGTSGSVNPKIDAGSFLKTKYTVGFDGIMKFYAAHQDADFKNEFLENFTFKNIEPLLYFSEGSTKLLSLFNDGFVEGNTGTFPGFYAPQGRELRLKSIDAEFLDKLKNCGLDNFEMETAGIYSFAKLLGHEAISLNCIIANRTTGKFLDNYKNVVDEMIQKTIEIAAEKL